MMEKETKIKIIGTGIFIVLLLCVAYLVYYSGKIVKDETIKSVKVSGNKLLSERDYLSFTRLLDASVKNKFSLPIIKNRFEKHPYVSDVTVKLINEKEARVYLNEKKIYAVIIEGSEAMFAADGFEVLPVLQNTKVFDVPVLSNLNEKNLRPLMRLKNKDMIQAYKIIDAAELTNYKMLKDMTEINLRNGGDIILSFSGLSIPVIFGRNQEAEKFVFLETLFSNNLINTNLLLESNYIDLRFYNDIYIGNTKRVEL
jgi:cell division septal protein FtsQ